MGDHIITAIVTIITAIIGVAIIATLVSPKANTTSVISASGSALNNLLGTAENPFSGSGYAGGLNVSTPVGGFQS